ncbi:DUF6458 family protein [Streptomyces sp. NRRL B-24484]|uniref:DUF6458 family protein n=1 Tax=Streptomyces sp. NRRL B-24484 TaxID=1463833 RepID=UPI002D21E92D|nr:DUF6458 family protein [Streptomyces sp. NRRL B-24484]
MAVRSEPPGLHAHDIEWSGRIRLQGIPAAPERRSRNRESGQTNSVAPSSVRRGRRSRGGRRRHSGRPPPDRPRPSIRPEAGTRTGRARSGTHSESAPPSRSSLPRHPGGGGAHARDGRSGENATGLGVSIFLLAAGAILAFAVSRNVSGVDLDTVGIILMAVGALGILLFLGMRYRAHYVIRDRIVDEPPVERRRDRGL